ncbi:hypothetical protein BC829DRAFT_303820 [Chytridium lagenaria]|nr:hypothetical protein BC829DRAFT_303820 [Chytridium lagenaria]
MESFELSSSGVGCYALGLSLSDVLANLNRRALSEISVGLGTQGNVVIDLQQKGIRLHFKRVVQRLTLVEIYSFKNIKLCFQGVELSSSKSLPLFYTYTKPLVQFFL